MNDILKKDTQLAEKRRFMQGQIAKNEEERKNISVKLEKLGDEQIKRMEKVGEATKKNPKPPKKRMILATPTTALTIKVKVHTKNMSGGKHGLVIKPFSTANSIVYQPREVEFTCGVGENVGSWILVQNKNLDGEFEFKDVEDAVGLLKQLNASQNMTSSQNNKILIERIPRAGEDQTNGPIYTEFRSSLSSSSTSLSSSSATSSPHSSSSSAYISSPYSSSSSAYIPSPYSSSSSSSSSSNQTYIAPAKKTLKVPKNNEPLVAPAKKTLNVPPAAPAKKTQNVIDLIDLPPTPPASRAIVSQKRPFEASNKTKNQVFDIDLPPTPPASRAIVSQKRPFEADTTIDLTFSDDDDDVQYVKKKKGGAWSRRFNPWRRFSQKKKNHKTRVSKKVGKKKRRRTNKRRKSSKPKAWAVSRWKKGKKRTTRH